MKARIAWTGKPEASGQDAIRDPISHTVFTADNSYRAALGSGAWRRLKPEIRRRFSVKPRAGQRIRYTGVMQTVELSCMGWLFAQACRLIGTPLATCRGVDVPMRIELVPDEELGGVAWLRSYDFAANKRFTVRSTKCRGSEGEFVEHIGCGFSMRLELRERHGDLVFTSIAYEVTLFERTYRIPDILTPGVTTVKHEQQAGDRFRFSLSVDHPLLGRTIYQDGVFYSDVRDV